MTTRNARSARRFVQVDPAASNPSLLSISVPVVTPTAAHSPTIIADFLANVKQVLDKWQVSSSTPNHLMQWLDTENSKMDRGWLQNAAFQNLFEHEKGIPETVEKRIWLFCLYLLTSGLTRKDGNTAAVLGKAYGIGEETVRRNNMKVYEDFTAAIERVHSSEEATLDLQELQQAFRAYEKWKPPKKKKKGDQNISNPVYMFLINRQNEMRDKFRGWMRNLLLGGKDPPFAPKERLLLFSLRAVLNGIDESFLDLLGEAFDFDQKDLLQELGFEAMSPQRLFASPSNTIVETRTYKNSVGDSTMPLLVVTPSNSKSFGMIVPVGVSPSNSVDDSTMPLPVVTPSNSKSLGMLVPVVSPSNSAHKSIRILTKEKPMAPEQHGEIKATISSLVSSVLEERKNTATIHSFSDETNATTTRNIVAFKELCSLPKILASTEGRNSDRVQIWLDLSQEEASLLMDSWAVSHVEEKIEEGVASLRAQGPRQKRTVKLAHLAKHRFPTEQLATDQRNIRLNRFDKVVRHFVGEGDPKYFLRGYFAKHHPSLAVVNKNQVHLTTQEAMALRDLLRISGNQLGRLDQFFRKHKDLRLFEPSIVKKMAATEIEIVAGCEVTIKLLALQVDKNRRSKLCVFWRINDAITLLEKQIEGMIVRGDFEKSEAFSSLKETMVVVIGGDKGGPDTSMLMRVANRIGGNTKDNCHVLAQYEDGVENYSNLSRTIHEKGSNVHWFMQDLLDDKQHAFLIEFLVGDGEKMRVYACKCSVLRLFECPADEALRKVLAKVQLLPDRPYEDGIFMEHALVDAERLTTNIDVARLSPYLGLEFKDELNLEIELITSHRNPDKHVGFQLLQNGTLLYTRKFNKPVLKPRLRETERVEIRVAAYQVVGFIAHDHKYGWRVNGQGGSAAMFANCLTCTQNSKTFRSNPIEWAGLHEPENLLLQKQADGNGVLPSDAPLRQGNFTGDKLFKIWDKETTGNSYLTEKELAELKVRCASVDKAPLLITRDKETGAPMHSAQGAGNHFFNLIRKETTNIDSFGNNLQEQIQEIHRDIILFVKDVEKLKKKQQAFKTRVTVLRNAIRKGTENGVDVSLKEANLRDKLTEMAQHAEVNEYTTMMRLLDGAKFLKGHVDTWFKHQNGFGESSHLFRAALPLFGGIYRAEHGGFELSNGDVIKVLEKWGDICELVSKAYGDADDEDTSTDGPQESDDARSRRRDCHKEVVRVMDESKPIAADLLILGKQMKDQDKRKPEDVQIVKDAACRYYTHWLKKHPDSYEPPPKIHSVFSHVAPFMAKNGMYGRLSEEGFESMHPELNSQKARLKGQGSIKIRIKVLNRRLQSRSDAKVEACREGFKKSIKTTANRPTSYQKGGTTSKINDDHSTENDNLLEAGIYYNIDGYAQDAIIRKNWLVALDVTVTRKVPAEWHRHIDAMEIGQVKKEESRYTTNM